MMLDDRAPRAEPSQIIADLRRERDEALAREAAIAEVLQVINSSRGDLAPVFRAMLEKALRLCEATHGTLRTFDGETFHLAAAANNEAVPLPGAGRGRSNLLGRFIDGEQIVHLADVFNSPEYQSNPTVRQGMDAARVRSWLGVSLRKEKRLLGVISVARQEVDPFSDKQIALLENFAAQAVIAMENARLLTETREALERQTATGEILSAISRSPTDVQPVFDAIAESAARLCEADFSGVTLFEEGLLHLVATNNLSPEEAAAYRSIFPRPPTRDFITGRAFVDAHPVHLADVLTEVDYNPRVLEVVQSVIGYRAALGVPIFRDGRPIGVIVCNRRQVKPFTATQIELVKTFADQAAIALANVGLYGELETRNRDLGEALEQQTATAEVLQVINSSQGDLAPVFDAILEKAHTLCSADYGSLLTYDGERFWPIARHGASERLADAMREGIRPWAGGGLDKIVRGEEPFAHIHDMAELAKVAPDDAPPRTLVEMGGIRTQLVVPLRKDDALLGIITANRRQARPFTDKEIALLQNFAAQAVIAMENARLLTELQQRTEDLEQSLKYQTATGDVLKVISRSTFDLQPVLATLVETAARLCNADMAFIHRKDGEFYYPTVNWGFPPEFETFVRARGRFLPDPRTLSGRTILERRIVRINDYVADPDLAGSEATVLGKARTGIGVPLLREGEPIGVIALTRQRVEPFTERQIELVRTFADQAVIAMENARLLSETREALEQQTATAEVLQVINSSPGDLAPVFEAMLEKALGLCEASFGSVYTQKGQRFERVASRGLPAEYLASVPSVAGPFSPGSLWDRIIGGENLISIADLAEPEVIRLTPRFEPLVRLAGARSYVAVALRKDEQLLGLIVIYRLELRPFTDEQVALLQNFAAQAVIAMENARLLDELRERTRDLQEALEYQTATSDVLKVISRSTFDLPAVLTTLVETAARLCEADRGLIATQQDEVYRVTATFAVSPEFDAYLRQLTIILGRGTITGRAMLERQVVHVDDLASDPEYALPETMTYTKGAHTALAVPLMREGEPIGAIMLAREKIEPFASRQIELVRTFADQAVIAIENARLLDELRQRTEEVAELNRGLEARVAEQVDELGRVGRLRRFLAPQLAELIVSQGDEKILESHRREIVVVFCDLRGYTAFTETAEPEEVLDFLREYHGALGPLVSQFEGTLDQFSGDGIMVFFNDPVPCPDPAERAVQMAMAMREAAGTSISAWRRRGRVLGFGAGIAQGYATLGQIGFADRSGYTAIGTVCNLAARLCAEAKDGQILVAQRVAVAIEETTPLVELGELALKGLTQPVVAFNVPASAAGAAAASPAVTA
jgi:GAF domain-containing protein